MQKHDLERFLREFNRAAIVIFVCYGVGCLIGIAVIYWYFGRFPL